MTASMRGDGITIRQLWGRVAGTAAARGVEIVLYGCGLNRWMQRRGRTLVMVSYRRAFGEAAR